MAYERLDRNYGISDGNYDMKDGNYVWLDMNYECLDATIWQNYGDWVVGDWVICTFLKKPDTFWGNY